jgi:hypothetical protein
MKNITKKSTITGVKESLNNNLKGSDIPSFMLLGDFSISGWDNKNKYKPLHTPSIREITEQLKIYPEAKKYLKQQTSKAKKILKKLEIAEWIIRRKSFNKGFWFDVIDILYRIPAEFIIKRNTLSIDQKEYGNKLNIDKAKQYPITSLLEFKHNTTICIFHNEKTASMHYNEKTNTVYCFGCHEFGDSIKVYQQLNNCSFVQAVKALQ